MYRITSLTLLSPAGVALACHPASAYRPRHARPARRHRLTLLPSVITTVFVALAAAVLHPRAMA